MTTINIPDHNADETLHNEDERPMVNKPNMIPIERAKAEDLVMLIEEALKGVEAQKDNLNIIIENYNNKKNDLDLYQTKIIQIFDVLTNKLNELHLQIDKSGSYEMYLEEKVKNSDLTKSVTMLELQLQQEKVEFMTFINQAQKKIEELKSADEIIKKSTYEFIQKVTEHRSDFETTADSKLEEISKILLESSKDQIEFVTKKTEEMLKKYTEKCQEHLDTLKSNSIKFLEQCSSTNEQLVKKVPAIQNEKYTKKDFLLVGMCIISVGFIVFSRFF